MTRETASLRAVRDDTIDRLCRRFASDDLSMAELERRLEKARGARTRDELRALLEDLEPKTPVRAGSRAPAGRRRPAPEASAPGTSASDDGIPEAAPSARPSTTAPAARESGHLAFAVMGGSRRVGRWVPPSNLVAVAIMGGVELDFRHALFQGGVVDINCFAFWGGIEIVVPPDVNVESNGIALMGGFDQAAETPSEPGREAPTIRINGLALMGGVEVRVVARDAPRKR